jgi:hypothetical protein
MTAVNEWRISIIDVVSIIILLGLEASSQQSNGLLVEKAR